MVVKTTSSSRQNFILVVAHLTDSYRYNGSRL